MKRKEVVLLLMIAVVDDDRQEAAALQEQIRHYLARAEKPHIIHEFPDGLDFIRSTESYDVVFMDIRMNQLDGLDAARIMRKVSRDNVLIFVTHMAQFAIKGYEVDALDFVLKPTSQPSIDRVLDKALKRVQSRAGSPIVLKTADGVQSISSNDLCYVEVYNHNLIYHTVQGDYQVRGQLGEVWEKLDKQQFILCSRSFLVNLHHVTSLHNEYLVVQNEKIWISKSHRKEIKQRFSVFLGESL